MSRWKHNPLGSNRAERVLPFDRFGQTIEAGADLGGAGWSNVNLLQGFDPLPTVLISNRNRNMNYFIAFTKCDAATTTKEICFYSLAKGREMLLE